MSIGLRTAANNKTASTLNRCLPCLRCCMAEILYNDDARDDQAHCYQLPYSHWFAVKHPPKENRDDRVDISIRRNHRYGKMFHRVNKRAISDNRSKNNQVKQRPDPTALPLDGMPLREEGRWQVCNTGCKLLHGATDHRVSL